MRSALQLPIFMMRPPSFIRLAAVCVAAKTARTLIANVRSKSASLISVKRPKHRYSGVVDKDVNPTQVSHSALDGANDRFRIRTVGLNGNGPNSRCLCGPGYLVGPVRRAGIGKRNDTKGRISFSSNCFESPV